jgi:hypothetical protein
VAITSQATTANLSTPQKAIPPSSSKAVIALMVSIPVEATASNIQVLRKRPYPGKKTANALLAGIDQGITVNSNGVAIFTIFHRPPSSIISTGL